MGLPIFRKSSQASGQKSIKRYSVMRHRMMAAVARGVVGGGQEEKREGGCEKKAANWGPSLFGAKSIVPFLGAFGLDLFEGLAGGVGHEKITNRAADDQEEGEQAGNLTDALGCEHRHEKTPNS